MFEFSHLDELSHVTAQIPFQSMPSKEIAATRSCSIRQSKIIGAASFSPNCDADPMDEKTGQPVQRARISVSAFGKH
jgi:hypothetical protein